MREKRKEAYSGEAVVAAVEKERRETTPSFQRDGPHS
jgi:hypothetical protein